MSTAKPSQTKSALEYYLLKEPRTRIKFDIKQFWSGYNKAQSKIKLVSLDWDETHEKSVQEIVPIALKQHDSESFVLTSDNNVTRAMLFNEPINMMVCVNSKEALETIKAGLLSAFGDMFTKGVHSKVEKLNFKRMHDAKTIGMKTDESTYKYYEFGIKLPKVAKVVKK